jgi:hypothetical protein
MAVDPRGTGGIDVHNLSQRVQERLAPASGLAERMVIRPGTKATAVLRVASLVAEGETVTIGADIYEVDIINTDSTKDTSLGQLNNTNGISQVTMTAHGRVAGDLIRVENEIMKVLRVLDANTIVVARGRCGTTIATHADALDIFISNSIPAAGRIPVGLVTTLTPAVFTPALAAEINNALAGGERATAKASTIYATHRATSLQAGVEMLLEAVSTGVLTTALSETLVGANNQWSAAAMAGGSAAAGVKKMGVQSRVPTATEVALGFMHFLFDFTPVIVLVDVVTTATGIRVAWVGGWTITGGRVTVDNAGGVDWAATDTVRVTAYE